MLTRPKNIVAHLAKGALCLTTNTLSPDESLGEDIPSVRFRARVPFFYWLHGRARNREARVPGMEVHTHQPRDHPISSPVFPGRPVIPMVLSAIDFSDS